MTAPIGQGSYSGNPDVDNFSKVRFLIPDTREPFNLSDAEVTYLLATYTSPLLAAAAGCEVIAGLYAGDVSKSIGSLSISGDQRAAGWRQRAIDLRGQASREGLFEVSAGGVFVSEKESMSQETDVVQPYTRIGQDKNPSAIDDWWFE